MGKSMIFKRAHVGLLAAMLACSFQISAVDAKTKKVKQPKPVEGVSDVFRGINSADQVKMTDPLWERYAYAGKRALEKNDIGLAQQYYWASCFELEDLSKDPKSVQFDENAKNVLTSMISLSNDVFFQDPNPANIRDVPALFPQPILPDEQTRVDAAMKALNQKQKDFDASHPGYDGGARLRMIHLRRRLDFSTRMMPVMKAFFGTDDGITRLVTQINTTDSGEFGDMSSQG